MIVFSYSVESIGNNTAVVTIRGEVGTCPAMRDLREEISEQTTSGNPHLILDMENVDHIDSAGLGFLMLLNGIVEGASGLMILLHLTPHVAKVIDFTRMEMVIKLADTMDEAKRLIAEKG